MPSEFRYGSLMDPLEDDVDPEDCADGGESIRNALSIGFMGDSRLQEPNEPMYEWRKAAAPVQKEMGKYEERPPEEFVDVLKFSRSVLTNWC